MKNAVWAVLILGLAVTGARADSHDSEEGISWLKKMANASRQLNYSGTFVYQHGNQSETSRIVHYVNPAGGEVEKLETLDGPAREVIRNNDQVTCYLPASKVVLIEQRNARHQVPLLLPERLSSIIENYRVSREDTDRVAGFECVWIALTPRDNLRYGRRFCAEAGSGLPLRSRTINENNQAIESFVFTELTIGGRFDRDKVKSKYAALSKNWRIDRSALNISENPVSSNWVLGNQPKGFRKLTEMKRSIAGRPGNVSHIVYTDGLAAVSVFIEPASRARPVPALTHQGAVNIYTRTHADHLLTVLGEAPAATVMQIANSLEYKAGKPAGREASR
jgi:sigma-E factor negative regulatory protein RseB